MTFKELNLCEPVLDAIGYMGFENATPIQEKAIPEIMNNRDLIACAQTGTGKTAAFMLPILHALASKPHKGTNTLIIVPTRELAIQIDQQIQGFSYFLDVHSAAIYGGGDGHGWDMEKNALKEGRDIIVATPGKLMSHIKMGIANFDSLEHLILDEADRMMDMGFVDDIMFIISKLPKNRQNLMFSATMPQKIRLLVKKILKDPLEISLSISKPAEGVKQQVYLAYDEQKSRIIQKVVNDNPDFKSILIFSSTKKNVFSIVNALSKKGHKAKGISSDLEQKEREQVLMSFRSRDTRILVATDVLSRGIDIKDIDLVLNFSVPKNSEDYVHRVGRTARSATKGLAITLVNPQDMRGLRNIEELIGSEIERIPLPEDFGAAPKWGVPESRKKNSSNKRKFYGKKKRNPSNQKGKENYSKGSSRQEKA